jgi:hypothetical protein
MSREASLIFFGVRFEISEDEITSVEERNHPIVSRARSVGLQVYWENIGITTPTYCGFAGRKIAILGVEDEAEVSIEQSSLNELMDKVRNKLNEAGISSEPKLYLCWLPPTT